MFASVREIVLDEVRELVAAIAAFRDRFDAESIPAPEVGPMHEHLNRARRLLDGTLTCLARHNLEIDHLDEWHRSHRTKLDRLAWLCRHHHRLETTDGHRLGAPAGQRRWHDGKGVLLAADDPDPPG
jgi:hypothetical protein